MLYMPQYLKPCTQCGERFPATSQFFYIGYDRNKKKRLNSACKICKRRYARDYTVNNKDKISHKSRVYKQTHKEQINAWTKQDRQKKQEQYRERQRRYEVSHREQIIEKNKKYRLNNKSTIRNSNRRSYIKYRERHLRVGKAYRMARSEQYAAYARNRRAQTLAVGGEHTEQDILRQHKAQKGKCYWCDCKLGEKYHVDHVIPLSKGGTNDPSNLVIACPTCNLSKHDKFPWEWDGNNGKLF
jgi:5-methylcytosine-specific restriction endonuclease McrA